jgi:osmoprotectant transport system substrate-binding protein
MRTLTRSLAVGAALALTLAACSSDEEAVTIGGFNFPESSILLETYAQALEADGVTVEREPDLGSREIIFPELTEGNIDIMPEYVGGAISSGFGETPAGNLEEAVSQLSTLFEEVNVAVLEPSPAEDADVFVVTADFADQYGTSLADLADAGDVVVGLRPRQPQLHEHRREVTTARRTRERRRPGDHAVLHRPRVR